MVATTSSISGRWIYGAPNTMKGVRLKKGLQDSCGELRLWTLGPSVAARRVVPCAGTNLAVDQSLEIRPPHPGQIQ